MMMQPMIPPPLFDPERMFRALESERPDWARTLTPVAGTADSGSPEPLASSTGTQHSLASARAFAALGLEKLLAHAARAAHAVGRYFELQARLLGRGRRVRARA